VAMPGRMKRGHLDGSKVRVAFDPISIPDAGQWQLPSGM
jgi:hypothetical protein